MCCMCPIRTLHQSETYRAPSPPISMSVGRKLGSEETRIGSISFAVMSAPLKLTSCCRTPWNPIVLQIRKLPLVFSGKWELERKP